MRWSKLRKLVQDTFAESVEGRVEVHSAAYRDKFSGRSWMTIDGNELVQFSSILSIVKHGAYYHESTETECLKHEAVRDEDRTPGLLAEPGEFSSLDFHSACWQYIHSSLADSLKSANPLVLSIAVLNGKVGRNKLRYYLTQKLHPLTRTLIEFRLNTETEDKADLKAMTQAKLTSEGTIPYEEARKEFDL